MSEVVYQFECIILCVYKHPTGSFYFNLLWTCLSWKHGYFKMQEMVPFSNLANYTV